MPSAPVARTRARSTPSFFASARTAGIAFTPPTEIAVSLCTASEDCIAPTTVPASPPRASDGAGCVVVSVDYRLAPKDPYPAALEDCYSALSWLARLPGVDPGRIAIGGASAGGGLAAALALLARDRGDVTPLFQLLVYPMVDDRPSSRPGLESPHYRMWSEKSDRLGWEAYLGRADRRSAVPARRDDLSNLAPAWVGVGTVDPLYCQGVEYAHRLRHAGVSCELDVVEGAFHGFDIIASKTAVAQGFFARQCEALQAAFGS